MQRLRFGCRRGKGIRGNGLGQFFCLEKDRGRQETVARMDGFADFRCQRCAVVLGTAKNDVAALNVGPDIAESELR